MSSSRRGVGRRYYLKYTIVFALLTGISLLWFAVRGKAFIWSYDGVTQHCNALAYYGTYLRGIIRGLVEQHRLIIPAYDFSIGYGADILTTLHYYALGDPLNLLSVFVPAAYTEYLYEALVILRMYLAGLSFSVFAGKSMRSCLGEYPGSIRPAVLDDAVLLGSVTYLFSEYVLYFFCKHPFFLTPMICLPLLLMGVDRVFEGGRGALYIAATALSALCSFYFFYMLGILTVIYAVFRYFSRYSFSIGTIGRFLLRFCLFTLLGIGIAAVILCPSVMSALGTERIQSGTYVPALYELKYYVRFFSGFISMDSPGCQTFLGYPAVAFLAVILLFEQKKRYLLKGGFLLLTVFLLIPFFGHVFNGLSYVSNRWAFAYSLLVSWIVVRMYPLLVQRLSARSRRILLLFTALEALACLAGIVAKHLVGFETSLMPMAVNLAGLAVLTVLFCFVPDVRKSTLPFGALVWTITVACVACNAFDVRTREEIASRFPDAGTVYDSLADTPSAHLGEYDRDGVLWRYGELGTGEKINSALQTGLYGTSFYFSVANPCIAEFRSSLCLNEMLDRSYRGMDDRSILEMFAGVRYYVTPEDESAPAGYERIGQFAHDGKAYAVSSRGADDLQPFLLGYDRVISREEFDCLPVEQRQRTLLDAMVCEDGDELLERFDSGAPETTEEAAAPTRITCKGDCSLEGSQLRVKKRGAKVVLESETDRTGEVYVVAEGLEYRKPDSAAGGILSGSVSKSEDKVKIGVVQGKTKKKIQISAEKGRQSTSSRDSFVCNLGGQKAGKKRIVLRFTKPGIYRFTDLRISLQPTAGIAKKAAGWSDGIGGTMSFDGNQVTADLTLDRSRLVCFAIPYDRGWSLEVDGKTERLARGNIMYCAAPLEAGRHSVRLCYRNPYTRAGAAVTLLCIAVFAVYLFVTRKKGDE